MPATDVLYIATTFRFDSVLAVAVIAHNTTAI
jgi:hypothetical protein